MQSPPLAASKRPAKAPAKVVVEKDPVGVQLVQVFQAHTKSIQQVLRFNKITGDGNCQFRAVARADDRYGENEYKRLRADCVHHVETNPNQFKDILPDGVKEHTPQMMATWAARMRKDKEYGDNLTLIAAVHLLQRPIVILDCHADQPPRPLIPRPWPRVTVAWPIYMRHQRKGTKLHYDLFTSESVAATRVEVPEVVDDGFDEPVGEIDITLSDEDDSGGAHNAADDVVSSSQRKPENASSSHVVGSKSNYTTHNGTIASEFRAEFEEFDDSRDHPALPPHVKTRDSLKRIARLGDGAREVIANAVTRLNDAVKKDPPSSDGAKKTVLQLLIELLGHVGDPQVIRDDASVPINLVASLVGLSANTVKKTWVECPKGYHLPHGGQKVKDKVESKETAPEKPCPQKTLKIMIRQSLANAAKGRPANRRCGRRS